MVKIKDIFVEKRNGEREPFDVSKIKQSIAFATEGQDVNPLHLEASLDQFIKNGITTSQIQDNVIRHAVQLASPQSPQWLNVAGRALAMQMWADYKLRGKTFLEVVKYNIKKGEYTKEIEQYYTDDDISELGKFIDLDRDLEHSHSSLITVSKKYLGRFELNQHMHMVNAMRFGQVEEPQNRMAFVKKLYDMLSLRKISLATPFMSNLRKGGNTSSCFIIALEDDLDSIFDNVKSIAKISKNGGGLGIFLGLIRAKGSSVGGVPNSAGSVTQWVKVINDTLVAVNQGGKRKGAGTVALPIWHNDVFDFLDMQTEHGDIRLKSYDVFPQITIPDIFMERDKQNGKWTTFCPYEVKQKLGIDIRGLYGAEFNEAYLKIEQAYESGKLKVAKQYQARDLFKTFMRTQFETGLPYIAFTDNINSVNPNAYNKESIGIPAVNLCVESFSNVMPDKLGHVCNLCSINLGNIDNMEELADVSRMSTRMLDYGIDLTNNPVDITTSHNQLFRTIGVGQMGLHDYLAKRWMNFSNLTEIAELSECVEYNAALESVDLARRFGSFGAFKESKWANGEMTQMFDSRSNGSYNWKELQEKINEFGMRNSQLTSPAPTTSTSIYQDASASILPAYSAFFSEDNKNGSLLVASKYLALNPIAYGKTFAKHTATEIIDVAAAAQQFIDTGISMELIFDQNRENFTAKELYDAVHYAHEKKIKAIYYIRSIKKNSTLETKEEACAACSG